MKAAQRGLTLIELLVAMALTAVVGVLLAALVNGWVKVRERLAKRQPKAAKLSYAESVEIGFQYDWDSYTPPVPNKIGQVILADYPIDNLVPILTGRRSLSHGVWLASILKYCRTMWLVKRHVICLIMLKSYSER